MAERSDFCPEECNLAVGSRRSRAAAFVDDETDEAVGSSSRQRNQGADSVQEFTTSAGKTIAGNKGEPRWPSCPTVVRILF